MEEFLLLLQPSLSISRSLGLYIHHLPDALVPGLQRETTFYLAPPENGLDVTF